MSELLPVDFGALQAKQSPQATTKRESQSVSPAPSRRNWTTIVLAAVVVFLLVMQFGGKLFPVPDPTPDIDIQGRYVLLMVDESQRERITPQQAQVLSSAKVADWCEERGIEYRRLDIRDDFGPLEDVWKELRKVATDQPSLTTLRDGKVTTRPVPGGIDATQQALSEVFD